MSFQPTVRTRRKRPASQISRNPHIICTSLSGLFKVDAKHRCCAILLEFKLSTVRCLGSSKVAQCTIRAKASRWCDYALISIQFYIWIDQFRNKVFFLFIHLSFVRLSSLAFSLLPFTHQHTPTDSGRPDFVSVQRNVRGGFFVQHISNNGQFSIALIFLLNEKRCHPLWKRNTDRNKLIYHIYLKKNMEI